MACEQQLARLGEPATIAEPPRRIARSRSCGCGGPGLRSRLASWRGSLCSSALRDTSGLTDDSGRSLHRLLAGLAGADRAPGNKLPIWRFRACSTLVPSRRGPPSSSPRSSSATTRKTPSPGSWFCRWRRKARTCATCSRKETRPLHPADFYLNMVRDPSRRRTWCWLCSGLRHAYANARWTRLCRRWKVAGQHPEMVDSDKLFRALGRPLCRTAAGRQKRWLGLFPRAMARTGAMPPAWSLTIPDDLAPLMGGKKKVPAQEVREPLVNCALRKRHSPALSISGRLARPLQGWRPAWYSMLCNNLAIKYRFHGPLRRSRRAAPQGTGQQPVCRASQRACCGVPPMGRMTTRRPWSRPSACGISPRSMASAAMNPRVTSPPSPCRSTSSTAMTRSASGWSAWTNGSRPG